MVRGGVDTSTFAKYKTSVLRGGVDTTTFAKTKKGRSRKAQFAKHKKKKRGVIRGVGDTPTFTKTQKRAWFLMFPLCFIVKFE